MQEKNLPKEGEILPSLNDKRPGSEKDLKYLDTPINSDPLKKTKAETRSGTAKTIESFAPILEAFSPTPSHSENTSLKLGTPGSPRIDTLNEEEALTNLLNVGLQLNDKNQRSSHNSVTDPSSSANSVNFSDNFDRPDMNSGLGISSTAFDSLPPSIIKDESPVPHAKSTSPSTSSSRKSSLSHHKVQLPRVGKIGVCAMDAKVLSKPCTQILNRLQENGQFTTIIFGDKVILDEKVENWPTCDFLISFFSKGFPLEKAIRYVNLRKPFMINDLVMQKALWDRRLCLQILQAANIPTPRRLMIIRDGGPKVDKQLKEKLSKAGVEVDKMVESRWKMIDDDTLEVDGHIMRKPFVEKPVDGEDHNIFIYYHSKNGGGGRRLFRKVGNKSSEFDPSLITPRRQGSYIYEEFMDTDNLEDVKAYTVGEGFCHAETRKSPVVDGIVRRNIHGKEVRYITELTDEEKEIARKVSTAFSQMICGFDLLRVKGKSYVIDVNGFSFVKDNTSYYDSCAQILRDTFIKAKKEIDKKKQILPIIKEEKMQNWVFKGLVSIIRHADRTPKQKIKYSFTTPIFIALLKGHKEEVIIRAQTDMEIVLQALSFAREENKEDPAKLKVLYTALKKKLTFRGTKIQLKPVINKDNEVEKVQFILKWGGEPTHSAPYQAQDLGEEMRQYFDLLNKDTLQDVTIYSSSERRVVLTAQTWANALFGEDEISSDVINIRKDLLDDSNAAKELMDKVKKRLKPLLRQHKKPSRNFSWPPEMPEPYTVVKRVVELMNFHKKVLRYNFANEDIENIQARWCCGEDPALFKERWEKLFKEFTSVEKLDPSKISELYDSMKYDALHNREFLQLVFNPNNCQDVKEEIEKHASLVDRYPINILAMNNFKISNNLKTDDADAQNTSSVGSLGWSLEGKTMKNPNAIPDSPFNDPSFIQFRELFKLTKVLFDFISPQEYGIEDTEKLDIGLLTSLPLAKQILNDLKDLKEKTSPGCVAYFTKESHIYTLLNIIYESGIPMKIVRSALPEFDYLSQINFELYESTDPMGHKTHAIRLKMSPGCHTQDPLDVQIDEKHYISCIPKISLTKHLDMDYCQQKLRNKFPRVNLPPKFIPVSITNPNLIFKKEIQAKMEKEEKMHLPSLSEEEDLSVTATPLSSSPSTTPHNKGSSPTSPKKSN